MFSDRNLLPLCETVLEIVRWKRRARLTMRTQKNKHRCKQANKFSDILFSFEFLRLNIVRVCVRAGVRVCVCVISV